MQLPVRKSRLNRRIDPSDNYLTPEALRKASADLRSLESRRPKAVEELSAARDMGDLSENAAYSEAKARLARMDTAMFHLRERIKNAIVIESGADEGGKIKIGTTVNVKIEGRERTFTITGGQESSPSEGRISHVSPLGRALIGHTTDESITIASPKGQKVTYQIISVK